MKKIKIAFIGLLSLAVCLPAFSQKSKGGWQNLFNGKDLTGWKQLNGQAKYEVKDGAIVGTSVMGTPNSFLTTEKDYGDFILEVDVKVDNKLNSGIQIRSLSKPDYQNGRVHGYQVEIDPSDRAYSAGIYDEARRGWLYPLDLNPDAKTAFKKEQWNKYRIEAIGNSIRTFLNGVAVAHVIDDMTPSGFICLQVHSIGSKDLEATQVSWKNVRIQTTNLKPSPASNIRIVNLIPNALDAAEKAQGWSLLYDGKTADQWRSYGGTDFPSKRWAYNDGTITISKSDGSETGNDIVTKKLYGPAFEFEFEFKLTEGANSGVKYFVDQKFSANGKSGIGCEYQVLDDEKHPDAKLGKNGNRTIASFYDVIPADRPKNSVKKIGEWNQGRIVVQKDGTVQHFLNGYKVVEYVRGSPQFKDFVMSSKFKNFEGFGMSQQGNLLLQDHGDNVSFRSLKVREL
ncbi:3-keto-disaccharide hydrolase [Dyadobacter sp.]|uniref:3-keto-disaccharide hydrolase n=1 Tax=Dyadobacter sp. TaxID=1914288 RepID=UPI003F6EC0B7